VQYICDTFTWLQAHITIPTATASNYIIAGLHDITKALHHLAKYSLLVLAPLTTNQVNVLEQLMTILHGDNKPVCKPMTKHCNKPLLQAPSLRVGPSQTEPQQIHPSNLPPLRMVTYQPPLRVVTNQPHMVFRTPDPSKVSDPMDISSMPLWAPSIKRKFVETKVAYL